MSFPKPLENADHKIIKNNRYIYLESHKIIFDSFGIMADKPETGKIYVTKSSIISFDLKFKCFLYI